MSVCPNVSELRFYGCCHPCSVKTKQLKCLHFLQLNPKLLKLELMAIQRYALIQAAQS